MSDDFDVIAVEPSGVAHDLTRYTTGELTTRTVDPGGYGGATFDLPRSVDAPDFEAGTEILIYDSETAEQCGGGPILNPGRSITAEGEMWKVAVNGKGPAHLQETVVPYLLIDTRLTPAWSVGHVSNPRLSWQQGDVPGGEGDEKPGWSSVISPGALNTGYIGRLNYYDMEQYAVVGLGGDRVEIGGYCVRDIEGNGTNANRIQTLIATFSGASQTEITDFGFDVLARVRRREVGTDWGAGGIGGTDPATRLTVRYERESGSTTVGGEDDWMHVYDMRVSALRLDRNRQPITATGTYAADPDSDWVLAHQAIIDSWARFCPDLDLVNARIDTGATFHHRDLVWPDGISPLGLADKLMEHDPAFTWAVWNRLPSGLYEAEWRQRDLTVRYEIPDTADFDQTSQDTIPYQYAYVVAEGAAGQFRVLYFGSTEVTSGAATTVQYAGKLDDNGFSEAAEALGTNTLEASRLRASAAQVTVTGWVYDHVLGRHIPSHLMRAGYLCRVAGVWSGGDTLNVGGDGAAIFRVASTSHTRGKGTLCDLNSYTLTEAQAIADLLVAVGP